MTVSASPNQLQGVAVVTGAGSGIGRATCKALVARGVTAVTLVDLNEVGMQETESMLQKINPDVKTLLVKADVADEAAVVDLHQRTVDEFGRIDYGVNAAGIGLHAPFAECTTEQWDKVMNINERAVFFCIREQIRAMKKQDRLPERLEGRGQKGAIVSTASVLGFKGSPGIPSYIASKHAVVGMAKAAMRDHAQDGIRINAIAPGFIDTPLTNNHQAGSLLAAATQPAFTPMGRPGRPEEIADVIAFMLSEEASFVNGATWNADGGFLG